MIAFAKPPAPDACFAGAQCTVTPLPAQETCPDCELEPSPCPEDFTITFSGLPDGMMCDPRDAERLKRELIDILKREGKL